jgi:hypothetical protein
MKDMTLFLRALKNTNRSIKENKMLKSELIAINIKQHQSIVKARKCVEECGKENINLAEERDNLHTHMDKMDIEIKELKSDATSLSMINIGLTNLVDERDSTIKCLTLENLQLENDKKHTKEHIDTLYKEVARAQKTIIYQAHRLCVEGK